MKVLKKFLYFIVFLIPFSISISPIYGINLPIIKILIFLFISFGILIWILKSNLKLKKDIRIFFSIFLIFFAFLLFFKSEGSFLAFKKTASLILYFSFFVMVLGFISKKDKIIILKLLSINSLIVGAFGVGIFFLQFFIDKDIIFNFLINKINPLFFGKEFSDKIASYPSYFVNIAQNDYLRANLFFPNPHIQSFYLAMTLPISIFLYKNYKRFLYLLSIIFGFLGFLLTFARGGYISFFISLIFFGIIFILKEKESLKKLFKFKYFVGFVIIFILIYTLLPIKERISDIFSPFEGSKLKRIELLKKGFIYFKENPLGSGVSNIYPPPFNFHNSYIELSVDYGIFPILSFFIIIFLSLYKALFLKEYYIFFSILFFCIYSFFETIIYSHQIMPLFFILISLI